MIKKVLKSKGGIVLIAVTYKEIDRKGTVYLPYKDYSKAKAEALKLYKEGYLNVKVVKIGKDIIYTRGDIIWGNLINAKNALIGVLKLENG